MAAATYKARTDVWAYLTTSTAGDPVFIRRGDSIPENVNPQWLAWAVEQGGVAVVPTTNGGA